MLLAMLTIKKRVARVLFLCIHVVLFYNYGAPLEGPSSRWSSAVMSNRYQIMLKCWEEIPSDRPTFAKLKETMKEMERNHKTYVNLKEYDNTLYANSDDLAAE